MKYNVIFCWLSFLDKATVENKLPSKDVLCKFEQDD